MRTLLLILLVSGALGWVAVTRLPWWGNLTGLLVLLVAGKMAGGRWLAAALKAPFKAKGAVLRGAFVHVHSVLPSRGPRRDAEIRPERGADADGRRLCMEVTISPQAQDDGPFQLWCPGDLQLVGPEARADDTDGDGDDCEIVGVEVADEAGRFIADEGRKYSGAQRLRLSFDVKPGVRRQQFRYHYELLGGVALPE